MKFKLPIDITLQYVIYSFGVIHASSKFDDIRTVLACGNFVMLRNKQRKDTRPQFLLFDKFKYKHLFEQNIDSVFIKSDC